jgi:hypothetical protein
MDKAQHDSARQLRSWRYMISVKSPWGQDIVDEQSMNMREVISQHLSD